jgi:hypothetical protein
MSKSIKFLSVVLGVFFCLSSIQLFAGEGDWYEDIAKDLDLLGALIKEAKDTGCYGHKIGAPLKILEKQHLFLMTHKNVKAKRPDSYVIEACKKLLRMCHLDYPLFAMPYLRCRAKKGFCGFL